MTHPSARFRTFAQLGSCASCLCLGLAFACGETAQNDVHDEMGNASRTASGPTNGVTSGSVTSGSITSGGPTTGAFGMGAYGTGGFPTDGFPTGGGVVNYCSSLEPAEGSACDTEGRVCRYANCTAPDYRDSHELNCVNGAWVLAVAQTCPVGPCLAEPPRMRSACDLSLTPGPCPALDGCGDVREAQCNSGIWIATDDEDADAKLPGSSGGGASGAAEAPICPASAPYFGEPCCPAAVPEKCFYADAETEGAAGVNTGGEWVPRPLTGCARCTDPMIWENCEE